MSRKSTVGKVAGVVGAVVVIAAGGAVGVVAERRARPVTLPGRRSGNRRLGALRGEPRQVVADDRLELYAEIDESKEAATSGAPTVVFLHGYALNLSCWHFQRQALRGKHRLVFYDQRSHGRSGRSRPQHCTIDQLGRDLQAVLDQVAGDDPVVLVGHSMGGMTIMALAQQHPEWFGERIVGVGLLSTSAGGLNTSTLGVGGWPGRLVHRVSPALVAGLARVPRLVDTSRRAGADIGFAMTRKLAFGGDVPDEYVEFTTEMLAGTPIDVLADFFPGFDTHDEYAALPVLGKVPTVVVGGTKDAVTPYPHTQQIADLLPSAELVRLEGCGHMSLLERHREVNAALRDLIARATPVS